MKKLWLTAIWVVIAAAFVALAVACSGTDAPAAFNPTPDAGGNSNKDASKADSSKDKPPPRPIDETPDAEAPDDAPEPQITSIAPDKAVLNGVGPTITVNGAFFVPRSKVLLDGAEIATSYEDESTLKATIPDDKLKAVAGLKVSVKTAAPGGGTSAEVTFAVENPKPELTALDPLSVATGSGTTLVKLTGTNFVAGAKVRFGTSDIPATVKSDTLIEATIGSNLLANSASVLVHVTNPLPGGGVTSDIAFTISAATSTVTSINPTTGNVGAASVAITVKGSGFVGTPPPVILFNGNPIATIVDASDQLRGTIPATALTAAADVAVTVKSEGGVSAPQTFSIVYPKAVVDSVTPNEAAAGGNPVDITVNGSRFFSNSKITLNGVETATIFESGTKLKATLTAAQVATAGTISVRVVNPTPGGGDSPNAVTITVKNGVPVVNAYEPAGVNAVPSGAGDTTVKILGANFVTGSTARARIGTSTDYTNNLAVTYVSASEISVVLPNALLKSPGTTVQVRVSAPAPGGGESSSTTGARLNVLCDSTGVNVHLQNLTTEHSLQPKYEEADKLSRWAALGGTCPNVDLVSAEQEPARYVIVANETATPMLVTAYGECEGGKGDGFLAIYKGGTAPADDNARKQCTGIVVEKGSPQSNGSTTCPGLVKGAGAIELKACERAVVHLQSFKFGDTNNPPPKLLKVKGEAP